MGALVPGTLTEAIKKNATPLGTEMGFYFLQKQPGNIDGEGMGLRTLAKDDERRTTMGTRKHVRNSIPGTQNWTVTIIDSGGHFFY